MEAAVDRLKSHYPHVISQFLSPPMSPPRLAEDKDDLERVHYAFVDTNLGQVPLAEAADVLARIQFGVGDALGESPERLPTWLTPATEVFLKAHGIDETCLGLVYYTTKSYEPFSFSPWCR